MGPWEGAGPVEKSVHISSRLSHDGGGDDDSKVFINILDNASESV
jgi:hypothetical protein